MNRDDILQELHRQGIVCAASPELRQLAGGVSGELWLIDDGEKRVVLKRALPKLRVKDDWFADISRNFHEQQFLDYVASFRPDAVPRVLYRNPLHGFFVMEYLNSGLSNWKQLLLAGTVESSHVQRAAGILGEIHRRSWNDDLLRNRFSTLKNFQQLRIDPYLLTTAERNPAVAGQIQQEAERLAGCSLCLVHGDFSPKNLLVSRDRLVVLDCEVAWFGDPAFDVAFLLNHLLLKSLVCRAQHAWLIAAAAHAWDWYLRELTQQRPQPIAIADLEPRVARLLLMLMLARIDGKSPVEYLDQEAHRRLVRNFVTRQLPLCPTQLQQLLHDWTLATDSNSV